MDITLPDINLPDIPSDILEPIQDEPEPTIPEETIPSPRVFTNTAKPTITLIAEGATFATPPQVFNTANKGTIATKRQDTPGYLKGLIVGGVILGLIFLFVSITYVYRFLTKPKSIIEPKPEKKNSQETIHVQEPIQRHARYSFKRWTVKKNQNIPTQQVESPVIVQVDNYDQSSSNMASVTGHNSGTGGQNINSGNFGYDKNINSSIGIGSNQNFNTGLGYDHVINSDVCGTINSLEYYPTITSSNFPTSTGTENFLPTAFGNVQSTAAENFIPTAIQSNSQAVNYDPKVEVVSGFDNVQSTAAANFIPTAIQSNSQAVNYDPKVEVVSGFDNVQSTATAKFLPTAIQSSDLAVNYDPKVESVLTFDNVQTTAAAKFLPAAIQPNSQIVNHVTVKSNAFGNVPPKDYGTIQSTTFGSEINDRGQFIQQTTVKPLPNLPLNDDLNQGELTTPVFYTPKLSNVSGGSNGKV
jgi:hypothetical protein